MMKSAWPLVVLQIALLTGHGCQQNQQGDSQRPLTSKSSVGGTSTSAFAAARAKGGQLIPLPWHVSIVRAAVAPGGKHALLGYKVSLESGQTFSEWVKLWDVQRGESIGHFSGLTGAPVFLAFLPDAKTAVVGDFSGVLRFYEIPSCHLRRELRVYSTYLV